jgi:formamidopyrimidine-DNA glycosylase
MPELPEVEIVRRGLDKWVTGRTIETTKISHSRATRNHVAGPKDFIKRLNGRTITSVNRRGKFMWLNLDDDHALVTHLGMSGQVLVQPLDAEPEKHLRIRCTFTDGGRAMHFVDQRTFGGMAIEELVATDHGQYLPEPVQHIARDPLDPHFDPESFIGGIRKKRTQVKRAILDQTLISGIGNIYADESLWRSKLHWAMPTERLTRAQATELLRHATEVMTEALAQGGTSFDALYVNVNGESGYFSRELNAYGREDEPCDRCGSLMVREAFANRSSFRCPKCQRTPRTLS